MGKAELKVDAGLLAQAHAAGVEVERVVESALRIALSKAAREAEEGRAARWAEENADAIQAHREQIEKHGVFGEDFRTW
jgi:antitoxin CcdA